MVSGNFNYYSSSSYGVQSTNNKTKSSSSAVSTGQSGSTNSGVNSVNVENALKPIIEKMRQMGGGIVDPEPFIQAMVFDAQVMPISEAIKGAYAAFVAACGDAGVFSDTRVTAGEHHPAGAGFNLTIGSTKIAVIVNGNEITAHDGKSFNSFNDIGSFKNWLLFNEFSGAGCDVNDLDALPNNLADIQRSKELLNSFR